MRKIHTSFYATSSLSARLKERVEDADEREMKVAQARAMRDKGMSYSQIAEALGYKSKSSVHDLLNED